MKQQPNGKPEIVEGDAELWAVDQRGEGRLAAGLLHEAENLRMTTGRPETRKGVTKPAWANLLTTGETNVRGFGTPSGVGVFRHPDSKVEWLLVAADGYVWRTRPGNQAVTVPLPAAVRITGPVSFEQAYNKIYMARGRHFAPLRMTDLDTGFVDLLSVWTAGTAYAVATEIYYGPFVTLPAGGSVTRVGETATVSFNATPHEYVDGADLVVQGAAQAAYNGRVGITVLDNVTFQYRAAGAPATPATGTIKFSNNTQWWRALGTLWTLTSITRVSTTGTATKAGHGFANGDSVTHAGAVQTEYNGTFTISNVTANTYDFTVTGAPATPATGTITSRNNTKVIADQTPDTNPEAWRRIYNILPNSERFLYINNRLLAATAFEPASADSYASFNGGSYAKTDFLVATDYLDEVHFDFSNAFRINQGSADEIVDLAKFNENTVVVWKGNSWGVLTNVALDLADLSLDMRSTVYGLSAPRAWAQAGNDLVFMAGQRGVVSIRASEQGKLVSVDLPLSAPMQPTVERINWGVGGNTPLSTGSIRVANWESRLYVAVPLDGARIYGTGVELAKVSNTYEHAVSGDGEIGVSGFVVGRRYSYTMGNSSYLTTDYVTHGTRRVPIGARTSGGEFVASAETYYAWGPTGEESTFEILSVLVEVNTGLMVRDFVCAAKLGPSFTVQSDGTQGWAGLDTGPVWNVLEFVKMQVEGRERLLFLDTLGWMNLVEESERGDQVEDLSADSGLNWAEIETVVESRGLVEQLRGLRKGRVALVALQTWRPKYSISAIYDGVNEETERIVDKTRSRTRYFRPWNAAAWDPTNVSDDWGTAYREDYSVRIPDEGLNLGSGVRLLQFQDVLETVTVRGKQGRAVRVRVTSSQGRIRILALGLGAVTGRDRAGTLA